MHAHPGKYTRTAGQVHVYKLHRETSICAALNQKDRNVYACRRHKGSLFGRDSLGLLRSKQQPAGYILTALVWPYIAAFNSC